jgi:hypothetical protein
MKINTYILFATLCLPSTAFASQTMTCSQLSDGFCQKLWSKENRGNLTLSDGNTISQGATPSKLIDNAQYLYFRKIIDRKCNLPQDLQEKLNVNCQAKTSDDLLARLDDHLKLALDPNFRPTIVAIKKWQEELGSIASHLKGAFSDVSLARLLTDHPELNQKDPAKLSEKEKGLLSDYKYNFSREWMDTVYLESPEWKRAKVLFVKVQKEILALIDTMGLDEESANFMRQKVASVQLTLPYEDPRQIGAGGDCSSTDINAFYNSFHHKFTVCIGMLNTVTSDGSLFFLMAHEIAHAIDPSNLSRSMFKQKTAVAKLVGKAYQTNGNIPCGEWQAEKDKALAPTTYVYALPASVNSVTQCLVDRSNIKPITPESLDYAMQIITGSVMNSHASQQIFTLLSQKQIVEEGAITDNGIYMDPQALLARSTENLVIDYYSSGELNVGAVFVQELRCLQQVPDKGEFVAFAEAMENSSKIITAYYENESRYMGQNSQNLQGFNISKPAGEDFSDWVAFQIYPSFLKSIDSIENRRNALLSGQTIFCSPSGIEELAMQKVTSEKKWAKTVHPLDRLRRMRFFTPEVAELVNCTRDESVEAAGSQCNIESIRAL